MAQLAESAAVEGIPHIWKELCREYPELRGKLKYCIEPDTERKSLLTNPAFDLQGVNSRGCLDRFSPCAKSTVLELAHVYCTSHQSNSFVASWYRAPCSAKQNQNFRSRLAPGPPAAPRSAALLNRVLAFRSSLITRLPRGGLPPKGC
jgi:hypothetical protein